MSNSMKKPKVFWDPDPNNGTVHRVKRHPGSRVATRWKMSKVEGEPCRWKIERGSMVDYLFSTRKAAIIWSIHHLESSARWNRQQQQRLRALLRQ